MLRLSITRGGPRRGGLVRFTAVAAATLVAASGLVTSTSAPAQADAVSVTLDGHGWGHGRGLGQWGAYGYAVDHGWNHQQILGHFYGGTAAGSVSNGAMTVRLTAMDGRDLLVTSGAPFAVGGYTIAPNSAVRLTRRPDGRYDLYTRYGCNQPDAWYAGTVDPVVTPTVAPGDDVRAMLKVCQPDGQVRAYRGTLSLAYGEGAQRTVNTLPLESYLRGVVPQESPASWGDAGGGRGLQALMAQAVAARSYAMAEGGETGGRYPYAKTCDTTACQVYGGAGLNDRRLEDPRTDTAVARTAGEVRRRSGRLVRTEFSSSTGGYTAGGDFPAVPDAGDVRSPNHNWSVTLGADAVAAAFGVGPLQDVVVTRRNGLGRDGGRVLEVRVVGASATRVVTGAAFRTALGLKSDWFTPRVTSAPGLQWFQRATVSSGIADNTFRFGDVGSTPLACDWTGSGVDTPATFRDGAWQIRTSNSSGDADLRLSYGSPGDVPVCGDWDGDGRAGPGVFRPSTWTFYLRNAPSSGIADVQVPFGNRTDRPVVGDWDGDGVTSVGVFRPENVTFYLKNANAEGPADGAIPLGNRTDTPVVGAWAGSRFTTIGVFRAGVFYLKHSNFPGPVDSVVYFGDVTDVPVVADWDGDHTTEPGVVRHR